MPHYAAFWDGTSSKKSGVLKALIFKPFQNCAEVGIFRQADRVFSDTLLYTREHKMEFIDRTAHIFSLPTYSTSHAWEHKDMDYVFWINDAYTQSKLSVDSYYMMQVTPYCNFVPKEGQLVNTFGHNQMPIIRFDQIESITVSCNSDVFKLISYKDVTLDGTLRLDQFNKQQSSIIYHANKHDLIQDVQNGTTIDMIAPFFIICKADNTEGTKMTNILIECKYRVPGGDELVSSFTVIRVGGVFVDESEQLVINAQNMGINLPKSILNGVYQFGGTMAVNNGTGTDDRTNFNRALYNEKLKEYLMHFMNIKGQVGNYKSAYNSLKWFGWGHHVKIAKLLITDNELLEQYVRTEFIPKEGQADHQETDTFDRFRNAAFMSLYIKENTINYDSTTGELIQSKHGWNSDRDFLDEGHPITENLFGKWKEVCLDENDNTTNHLDYLEPYYIYNKNIILLKLAFLKYYYKKYFLPVHFDVLQASVEKQCFVPDIKQYTHASIQVNENPVLTNETGPIIEVNNKLLFSDYSPKPVQLFFGPDKHYMDRDYCSFSHYCDPLFYNKEIPEQDAANQVYESHELALNIPIRFYSSVDEYRLVKTSGDKYRNCSFIYNTTIILSKEDKEVLHINKTFTQGLGTFNGLIMIPKLLCRALNKTASNLDELVQWQDDKPYKLDININGGKWYTMYFTVSLPPHPEINTFKLEYQYDESKFVQLHDETKMNAFTDETLPTSTIIKFNNFMWETELVEVTNINYPEMLSYDIHTSLKHYRDTYALPSDRIAPHYYNLIVYYDLNISWDGLNAAGINHELYLFKTLFERNEQGHWTAIQPFSQISEHNEIKFDMYLMHDADKFWLVYISRDTLDKLSVVDFNSMKFKNELIIPTQKATLRANYAAHTTRFLINRMKLSYNYDKNNRPLRNVFNKKDIICTSLKYSRIPFSMVDSGTAKWSFIPTSLININNTKVVTSKANTGIMSLQETETDYLKGYYTIQCEYSLDGKTTQKIISPYKIRIED